MRRRELVAWGLVAVLGFGVAWQWVGASKQEGRAEAAEERAKVAIGAADQARLAAAEQTEQAEQQLRKRNTQIDGLQARLRAALKAKAAPGQQVAETWQPAPPSEEPKPHVVGGACEPLEEKIGTYPTAACTIQGSGDALIAVVPALAAIEVQRLEARLDSTETILEATQTELAATRTALEESQKAMGEWKKAAKKSRIRRIFGAISKPIIFAVGVFVGTKL
ncbi:MAG: hypothetical protein ACREBG_17300 [Pyrinomonadaceae bacterium]